MNSLKGSICGREVQVIITGPGSALPPGPLLEGSLYIVSAGICGALSGSLRCGDIVVAKKVGFQGLRAKVFPTAQFQSYDIPESRAVHDLLLKKLDSVNFQIVLGASVTVEKPLIHPAQKKEKERQTGSVSVDMEDYFRAQASRRLKIPFASIRAVYDEADEEAPASTERLDKERLSVSTASLMESLRSVIGADLNFT